MEKKYLLKYQEYSQFHNFLIKNIKAVNNKKKH
jgi:hypothetical protein